MQERHKGGSKVAEREGCFCANHNVYEQTLFMSVCPTLTHGDTNTLSQAIASFSIKRVTITNVPCGSLNYRADFDKMTSDIKVKLLVDS